MGARMAETHRLTAEYDFEEGVLPDLTYSETQTPAQILADPDSDNYLRLTSEYGDQQFIPEEYTERVRSTVYFTEHYTKMPEITATNLSQSYISDVRFHPYSVEDGLKIRNNFFELYQRSDTTPASGYGDQASDDGPVARFRQKEDGEVTFHWLAKNDEGVKVRNQASLGTFETDRFYNFRLDATWSRDTSVGRFEVFIDGVSVLVLEDLPTNMGPTSNRLPAFKAGLYGDNAVGAIDFDNVQVFEVRPNGATQPPPSTEPQPEPVDPEPEPTDPLPPPPDPAPDPNDLIYGGDTAETFRVGDGADEVHGGGGGDIIRGGQDADTLFGDAGDDIASGDRGQDLVYGGDGRDVVRGGAENDQVFGGAGNDFVVSGDSGDDSAHGGDGNDVVRGGAGNDQVYGDAGDDRVIGDHGDDQVFGGAGADVLLGFYGDDFLLGGLGNDVLAGGGGADVYAFAAGDGRDVILDYEAGVDKIDISAYEGMSAEEVLGTVKNAAAGGVKLDLGGDSVVLRDMEVFELTVEDFIL